MKFRTGSRYLRSPEGFAVHFDGSWNRRGDDVVARDDDVIKVTPGDAMSLSVVELREGARYLTDAEAFLRACETSSPEEAFETCFKQAKAKYFPFVRLGIAKQFDHYVLGEGERTELDKQQATIACPCSPISSAHYLFTRDHERHAGLRVHSYVCLDCGQCFETVERP